MIEKLRSEATPQVKKNLQRIDCTADLLLPLLRDEIASGTARSTMIVPKILLLLGTNIETS